MHEWARIMDRPTGLFKQAGCLQGEIRISRNVNTVHTTHAGQLLQSESGHMLGPVLGQVCIQSATSMQRPQESGWQGGGTCASFLEIARYQTQDTITQPLL